MDANQLINSILDAIQHKHWQAVAALVLVGAVALIRWLAPKIHGKVGAWLNSDRGGTALVLAAGTMGAISSALVAGQHITINLLWGGIATGVMASGGWNVVKKLIWPADAPAQAAAAKMPAKTNALLPFVLVPMLFASSSCKCWQPAGQNDVGCVVAHQMIDCTVSSVSSMLPVAVGVIGGLIGGQTNVDWASIEAQLESAGIRDGSCILAALENDFITKQSAHPMGGQLGSMADMNKAIGVHGMFMHYKEKHGLQNVHFKLPGGVVL